MVPLTIGATLATCGGKHTPVPVIWCVFISGYACQEISNNEEFLEGTLDNQLGLVPRSHVEPLVAQPHVVPRNSDVAEQLAQTRSELSATKKELAGAKAQVFKLPTSPQGTSTPFAHTTTHPLHQISKLDAYVRALNHRVEALEVLAKAVRARRNSTSSAASPSRRNSASAATNASPRGKFAKKRLSPKKPTTKSSRIESRPEKTNEVTDPRLFCFKNASVKIQTRMSALINSAPYRIDEAESLVPHNWPTNRPCLQPCTVHLTNKYFLYLLYIHPISTLLHSMQI